MKENYHNHVSDYVIPTFLWGIEPFFNDLTVRDATRGFNSRIFWGDSQQNLSTGIEYGHVNASNRDLLSSDPPFYDLSWDHWALFGNGAYTIERLTILPGIRYDHSGVSGDNTNYTLGATYKLTENTVVRAYGANGFSLTNPTIQNTPLQKISTIQSGIETTVIPYLWLKGTYFNNYLKNSQSAGLTPVILNQNRQGFEVEVRTTPVLNLALTSGYTYLYAKNTDTGERLQSNGDQAVPPHTVKLALNYDKNDLGLRGTLTGNYVWWNSPANYPTINNPSVDSAMIWDLHLNWKINPKSELSPELFLSGHNLFNGVQTVGGTELYTNAKRWFDGGLRVRF